ncbi:hypothetical protein HDU81_009559 [Chytriomyces hyalinus]|nr:hypothetical protein HDU81_009559 [Chytriomyces hyalinus]
MTPTSRNATLLNAIYDFTHMTPSDSQSHLDIALFIRWISADRPALAFCFRDEEKESVRQACLGLTSSIPQEGVPTHVHLWFPKHGCAVLIEYVCEGMLGVKLLFPDSWIHKSKRIGTGESIEYSIPHSHETIFFSTVDSDLFTSQKFDEEFDKALQEAEKRTGNRRTAAAGDQGNQKTPAFIAALVRQVLAADGIEVVPVGGTTDVGLHTGGRHRCTSWPLVIETLKLLVKSTSLFNRYISEFHLKHLQVEIEHVQELSKQCKLTPTDIDEASAVLRHAGDAVQKTATDSRVDITEAMPLRATLDKLAGYRATCIDPEPIRFLAQPLVNISSTIQARRNENIGLIMCFDNNGDEPDVNYNFESLLLWAQNSLASIGGVSRATALILVVQTIESFLWKQACLLSSELDHSWRSYHLSNVKALEDLYEMQQMNGSPSTQYVNQEYPLLNKYGIPLDASQLEVLVVKDSDALDAMLLVRRFLHQNRKERNMTVFSLDEMGGTFSFGLEFAEESKRMRSRYLNEVSNAEKRKNAHWLQVVAKKARL